MDAKAIYNADLTKIISRKRVHWKDPETRSENTKNSKKIFPESQQPAKS